MNKYNKLLERENELVQKLRKIEEGEHEGMERRDVGVRAFNHRKWLFEELKSVVDERMDMQKMLSVEDAVDE